MNEITLDEFKENLGEVIKNAYEEGERFIIIDGDDVIAGIVPPEDIENLEELDELAHELAEHGELKGLIEDMMNDEEVLEEDEK